MQPSFDLLFDPSEDAAIHWAARTGLEHALDLRTVEQLYARALPYIKNWAWALTAKHGWAEEAIDTVGDMPLAVCLGRDELQGVNGDISYVARLVLPTHFSDLLNPEFTNDWAAMFSHLMTPQTDSDSSADIFQLGRAGIPRPLQNILYLLQILSPGLLLLRSSNQATYDDEDDEEWGPQGIDLVALPPSIWVGLHIEDLEDIFGAQTAVKLYQAAEDPYCASEDASSVPSYGSQDSFDQFNDAAFSSDDTEDWPELEAPIYGQEEDDDVLSFAKPSFLPVTDAGHYGYSDSHFLSHLGHANNHPEQHLIPDVDNGKESNLIEYRHCDVECNFCGMCSSRFAERLTERLLMHGALMAI
ncbi:hypothetical protein FRB91_001579 [Serendipita sp. 411]|nr:hypothetical protein FRC16_008751 [Serendipita sp. 398]KAG8855909.1 hypothetical protein FRB91_001579 [Serendipita sp. 411]